MFFQIKVSCFSWLCYHKDKDKAVYSGAFAPLSQFICPDKKTLNLKTKLYEMPVHEFDVKNK